jgi:hypothetical protein
MTHGAASRQPRRRDSTLAPLLLEGWGREEQTKGGEYSGLPSCDWSNKAHCIRESVTPIAIAASPFPKGTSSSGRNPVAGHNRRIAQKALDRPSAPG